MHRPQVKPLAVCSDKHGSCKLASTAKLHSLHPTDCRSARNFRTAHGYSPTPNMVHPYLKPSEVCEINLKYIQGVSGGIVSISGGGSMDYCK